MRRILLGVIFTLSLVPAGAETLEQVLAAMDQAAPGFEDMTAGLMRTDFTAVISDTTEESGNVWMKRSRDGRVRMLIEFTQPDLRSVAFADRKAEMYYPKIKTVEVYDLGKYRNLIDEFLLLGFGSSGAGLKKSYAMKLLGAEEVHGVNASRLELVPKLSSAQGRLKKVELWISEAGYPVRQKFYWPSGNYTLVSYSGLKINPHLSADVLKLKLPAGVRRVYPQK